MQRFSKTTANNIKTSFFNDVQQGSTNRFSISAHSSLLYLGRMSRNSFGSLLRGSLMSSIVSRSVASWKIQSSSHQTKYSVWTWDIKSARPLFQPLFSGSLKYRIFSSFSSSPTISESFINDAFVGDKIQLLEICQQNCVTISWTVVRNNNRYFGIIISYAFNKSLQTTMPPFISCTFENILVTTLEYWWQLNSPQCHQNNAKHSWRFWWRL